MLQTAEMLCSSCDNPDIFFPTTIAETREAKSLCARCPGRTECLEKALARPSLLGVWGGMTRSERRALRKKSA